MVSFKKLKRNDFIELFASLLNVPQDTLNEAFESKYWEEARPRFAEMIFNEVFSPEPRLLNIDQKNRFTTIVKLVEEQIIEITLGNAISNAIKNEGKSINKYYL